jgi:hypothetical protein
MDKDSPISEHPGDRVLGSGAITHNDQLLQ